MSELLPTPPILSGLKSLASEQPLMIHVQGASMLPILAAGQGVTVAPSRRYFPGDILVFRSETEGWTVHRLLGVRWRWNFSRRPVSKYFVTRGDNAVFHDAPVEPSRVLGKVTHIDHSPYHAPVKDRTRACVYFVYYLLQGFHKLLISNYRK